MSNKKKRRNIALGVMAVVVAGVAFMKSSAPKITLPDVHMPDISLPDWLHFPDWSMPDFHWPDWSSISGVVDNIQPWMIAVAGLVLIGTVVYIKKRGMPSIPHIPGIPSGGGKYAPKGKLKYGYDLHNVKKMVWGNNTFDNGVVAVDPDSGDLYMAGGDGSFGNSYFKTAILKCPRGKNPRDKNSWSLYHHRDGKCYGMTIVDGNVIIIASDSGSMWDGAQNWRIRNVTTGKKSGHIDDWFGDRWPGQFTFLNGKVDGAAHIYYLRAVKPKFYEFGGPVRHVSVKRSKLIHPEKLNKGDFSKAKSLGGLIGQRVGTGTGWAYGTQVDVFRDGSGQVHASIGEFVNSKIYRYKSDKPDGDFHHYSTNDGWGVPRGTVHPSWAKPSEHYTRGAWTLYLCYFGGEYLGSQSGSWESDGVYFGDAI